MPGRSNRAMKPSERKKSPPPRGAGGKHRPPASSTTASTTRSAAPGPRTDWGKVAEWYDDLVGDSGSEFHREVVLPGVVRLLAPAAGERVLDVACGQGVLCRLL